MRAGAGYVTACVPASLNVIFESRLLEVDDRPGCRSATARSRRRRGAEVLERAERVAGARARAGPRRGIRRRSTFARELAERRRAAAAARRRRAERARRRARGARRARRADGDHAPRGRARPAARDRQRRGRRAAARDGAPRGGRGPGGRRAQGRRHARRPRPTAAWPRSAAAARRRWPPPAPATSSPA